MDLHEIVLPETKPETEWVGGRALQKVSPQRNHARLQGKLFTALDAWALGRGEVGTEWRFRVAPPGEVRRPLIPDIAFVSADRLRGLSIDDIQTPAFAPNVAIEVLSPNDLRAAIETKIDVYLRAGTDLVIIVDPLAQAIELHDSKSNVTLGTDGRLEHPALPGFVLEIGPYFAAALGFSG
jgi:Uma2 family endonuclease